jgi:MFS family permease
MLALNAVTSSAGFIALMAGLGIANALISTSGSIVVAADSPPIRRGEALSLYYVASSTGVALGPVVGFTLADIGGLRLNLIVATTLAVVLAALVLTLPPSRTRSPATAVVGRLWSAHAVAASLTLVVITTGQATVYAFLPLYAAATGIGRIAWFFPLMSGCTIVCRLLLRRASDTFGRAPVLMPAITAVALGNALLAVPPSVGTLVLSAALLGSGNSMLYPTLVALVVDRAPERERGLAIGTVSGAWDVGVALGSPVIAFLVHGFGYGVGFLASAVAAALGLLVFALTERRRRRRTLSALAAAD